jgi:hypothetical protein
MTYVAELGYTGTLNSINLNWGHIPSHWQFLIQLMCYNLTPKTRGKDYANRRILLMWITFIFDKKFDIARLIMDEIREYFFKRNQYLSEQKKKVKAAAKAKSEDKKPYIPFQRFLQTIVERAIIDSEGKINPRPVDHQYNEYVRGKFKTRPNATKDPRMPIPEHLFDRIPI